MATLATYYLSQSTAVIWGEAGGSGVTNTLSLDALATGSARMGAAVDLGANWNQLYSVQVRWESGTAPTAGGTIDVYLACSFDNSTWPAGVTGSDGAWPADGNEDEWSPQLGAPAAVLYVTNDANTLMVQNGVVWRPSGRYVAPVYDNGTDQNGRDQGTASNNLSRVILVPLVQTADG